MKKDDYLTAQQHRERDEALRLAKIYIVNRLVALNYWKHRQDERKKSWCEKLIRDLKRQLRTIAHSLPRQDPLFHRLYSFADNVEQVWILPEGLTLIREMHQELDPSCDTRSIVPSAPQPAWRDTFAHGH